VPRDCSCLERLSKLLRRPIVERTGRPLGIVVAPPRLHDLPGIGQPQEPVLIQAFVTQPTVEALAVRVLDRLAEVDETPRDR
jgi:hypothetical protein